MLVSCLQTIQRRKEKISFILSWEGSGLSQLPHGHQPFLRSQRLATIKPQPGDQLQGLKGSRQLGGEPRAGVDAPTGRVYVWAGGQGTSLSAKPTQAQAEKGLWDRATLHPLALPRPPVALIACHVWPRMHPHSPLCLPLPPQSALRLDSVGAEFLTCLPSQPLPLPSRPVRPTGHAAGRSGQDLVSLARSFSLHSESSAVPAAPWRPTWHFRLNGLIAGF